MAVAFGRSGWPCRWARLSGEYKALVGICKGMSEGASSPLKETLECVAVSSCDGFVPLSLLKLLDSGPCFLLENSFFLKYHTRAATSSATPATAPPATPPTAPEEKVRSGSSLDVSVAAAFATAGSLLEAVLFAMEPVAVVVDGVVVELEVVFASVDV